VTRLRAGRPRPDSRQGQGYFPFGTASRPALEPIQWVRRALSLGVKQPGCAANHPSPNSAEIKNAWSYTSTPPMRFHGVVFSLKNHRDNFTFTFYNKEVPQRNAYTFQVPSLLPSTYHRS